jgi:HdeA/HdeB family
MKLTLAFAALTLFAAPAFADEMADPAKMTCADFVAADMDGMMKDSMMMKEAMKDDAKMSAMTDEDMMHAMMEACKMHPDTMVMDALHM